MYYFLNFYKFACDVNKIAMTTKFADLESKEDACIFKCINDSYFYIKCLNFSATFKNLSKMINHIIPCFMLARS